MGRGQYYRWKAGPEVVQKAGWATRSEQASKWHSSIASASGLASSFLSWVTALTSLRKSVALELHNKHFPPQTVFGRGVLSQQLNP